MNDGFNLSRIDLLQPLVVSGYVALNTVHLVGTGLLEVYRDYK